MATTNSIASTMEGQYITGTPQNDYIVVNHRNCKAYGEDGDDIIDSHTDNIDLYGGGGNDFLISYGNISRVGSYDYTMGDDTLISDGIACDVTDTLGSNLFLVGGDQNTVRGGIFADTFGIYSYNGRTTNTTLTGGGNNDAYIISTGLASVLGETVGTAAYNPYSSDTVNVAISDFDSLDTLYIRDFGFNAINHSVTGGGVFIYDDTGRVNLLLGQGDWEAVKNTKVTCDDAQGNIVTLTLEQAQNFWQYKAPAGVYISGDYLNISASFVGNLIMSGEAMNYQNGNIVTIDAQSNPQSGMFIGGNENANTIYAGYGGNFLWGGAGFNTTDYLIGGAGADIFLTGKNDGTDLIFNADINDTIQLYDTNLSDIVSFGGDDNSITLGYNTGNVTAVATSETLSPKFQLADGSAYRFNRATNSWQVA